MMRLILVSMIAVFLFSLVAGEVFAADDVPSALPNTDLIPVADEDGAGNVEAEPTQLLTERSPHRHEHRSSDEDDHNRGHHSQRASTEDSAVKRARAKPQKSPHRRAPPERSGGSDSGEESGQQSDWRQYVPAAYRKYLPDESSTAAPSSYHSHKKSSHSRSRSHKSVLSDNEAAAAATEAEAEATTEAAVNMENNADAVEAVEEVAAEKLAAVNTTSSLTWFLLLIAVVLLSASGIALAAYIANKKDSDYAPLPTREIY